MKIYTKRGDSGQTDLFGGERVLKSHIRVKAYGAIDCANSAIGMAASISDLDPWLKDELIWIMKLLFCAGSEIATSNKSSAQALLKRSLANQIAQSHIDRIEQNIDAVELKLEPLKNFILPSGSDSSSKLQFARTLIRQAEISLIELSNEESVRSEIIRFFNRLSDYLFVLGRLANKQAKCQELLWNGQI
jgi:cob(I)alamin adenosyltransferase